MYICYACCDKIDPELRHGFFSLSDGLCEMCEKPSTCLDIHHSHLPARREEEREYEPPTPRLTKTLLQRLQQMLNGEVECGRCQQPIQKCMCEDERFQAAMAIAEARGRAQVDEPLQGLVRAALAWRRRTDSPTLSMKLALAIDSYERKKTP